MCECSFLSIIYIEEMLQSWATRTLTLQAMRLTAVHRYALSLICALHGLRASPAEIDGHYPMVIDRLIICQSQLSLRGLHICLPGIFSLSKGHTSRIYTNYRCLLVFVFTERFELSCIRCHNLQHRSVNILNN